jgi:hypothetical protein
MSSVVNNSSFEQIARKILSLLSFLLKSFVFLRNLISNKMFEKSDLSREREREKVLDTNER